MKKWHAVGGAIILGIVVFVILWIHSMSPVTVQAPAPVVTVQPTNNGQPMLPTKIITIGNVTVLAELATTSEQKGDGLSGRVSLQDGAGMLFVFDTPSVEGFWMKDMRFSLDIIYAAQDGTILTIHPDLSPQTYPTAYYPSAPASYVLEVPAGFAAEHGIAVGDKIVI